MTATTTITLTDFLLARIAEDEQAAQDVHRGPEWTIYEPETKWGDEATQELVGGGKLLAEFTDYDRMAAYHVARHDPARVLAECEAHRQIVKEAQRYSPELDHGDNGEWAFDVVLRSLAQPCADHPDFNPEWRLPSTQ